MQADDQDVQHGLGNAANGKSRKGQGRWLSRWLQRDSSSRKQGRDKAENRKSDSRAMQQKLQTKSAEPKKAPAIMQGPGELAPPQYWHDTEYAAVPALVSNLTPVESYTYL